MAQPPDDSISVIFLTTTIADGPWLKLRMSPAFRLSPRTLVTPSILIADDVVAVVTLTAATRSVCDTNFKSGENTGVLSAISAENDPASAVRPGWKVIDSVAGSTLFTTPVTCFIRNSTEPTWTS